MVSAAEPHLAFAWFPERPAFLWGPAPNRQLSADQREVPADLLPAHSDRQRIPGDSSARRRSGASLPGRASHSDSRLLEQVPSRRRAREAPLWYPGLAAHWPSATLGPWAAHLGMRLWARTYLAQPSDPTARLESQASPRD